MSGYHFMDHQQLKESDPPHTLPDPFLRPDGTRAVSPEEWPEQRTYLKAMLAHYLYGEMPPAPGNVKGSVVKCSTSLDGIAIQEKVALSFGPEESLHLEFTVIRPESEGKHPVLIWNTFGEKDACPILAELIGHGIAFVSFDKEQLGVDNYAFYRESPVLRAYPGCSGRAIAIWAWGYSRIVDYLETTDYADMDKIAATGYSRNGKVALCAAVYDERITLAAPGGSGCGGSGCFRFMGDRMGEGSGVQETIGSMSQMFAYWWADGLREFGAAKDLPPADADEVAAAGGMMEQIQYLLSRMDLSLNGKLGDEWCLPFDMHFARALIAPRPLLTTDSLDDEWANPYGIQVSWRASAEIYRMLGVPENDAMFLREGKHMFSLDDWTAIADFIYFHFLPERERTDPRHMWVTLQIPEDPEADQNNTMTPKWYRKTPHFTWSAAKGAEK